MNHYTQAPEPKRIAIIGSGISGLSCGYLLSPHHHVTLFEANNYLGGHTATIDIEHNGETLAIDTGFIVFNDRTYPNFINMMRQNDVAMQPTQMSFSVHNDGTGLEYNGHNLNTLFAQRRNVLNPRFYYFIREILRFNKLAKHYDHNDSASNNDTLGEFLSTHGFSDYFATNYILAMVAAIWSSSVQSCKDFPLRFFLRFFNNHGLLDIENRPQWYVLAGGSRSYIPKLSRNIQAIRLNSPVQSVQRHPNHVAISSLGQTELFDEVIFACHSDQALALLADASTDEQTILGAIPYRDNEVVLHTDTRLLPVRKAAHASWNYWLDADNDALPSVTYNMNILQGLSTATTYCVSLNQTEKIAPPAILRSFNYSHPVFTRESLAAQQQRTRICGYQRTHYCGAYWYNGFHEDGVNSALDVCQRFGVSLNNSASTGAALAL